MTQVKSRALIRGRQQGGRLGSPGGLILTAASAQSQERAWLLVMLTFLDAQPTLQAEPALLLPIQLPTPQ